MNVSLTPELERLISEKVQSGFYTTASEVVREALRLLFDSEQRREQLKARLNAELQIGLDELDRGETFDGEEVMREIKAMIDARAAEG